MADPFYGEIRLFTGTFVPADWAACDGTLLQIQQYQALYAVIGITYGGDGKTTFALPNLNGRVPVHQGQGPGLTPRQVGKDGGSATVTLTQMTMPNHTHTPVALDAEGTANTPTNAVWAQLVDHGGFEPESLDQYTVPGSGTPVATMAPAALMPTGGNQAHNNMQPYLPLRYIICLYGEFPMRP